MTDQAPGRHVFISFSSRDAREARLVCERLERDGLRCWISNRDVDPGRNYQSAIVEAIGRAAVMVLVFSANSNESREVPKEISLASSFDVPVVPVRISDVRPSGALQYELATRQWVDAFAAWDDALDVLAQTVRRLGTGGATVETPAGGTKGLTAASHAPASASETSNQPVHADAISPADREAARAALAALVGPIADMLVRKAAARAKSPGELHDLLARELASSDEQTAFRQALSRLPASGGGRR